MYNFLKRLLHKPKPQPSIVSFIDYNTKLGSMPCNEWLNYAYIDDKDFHLVGFIPKLYKERPSEVLLWATYQFLEV